MLFHELYGSYFDVVAAVLEEAVKGSLTSQRLGELVWEKAFAESVLTIPAALQNGEWPLLDKDMHTPIRYTIHRPLTTLEKRWLKALSLDSRIRLFNPPTVGLEDIEPLFKPDMFVFFDRYTDGDPFEDANYIAHFQTVLAAIREKRNLRIEFEGRRDHMHNCVCVPCKLEYSPKDDKFRLLTAASSNISTINISRITKCSMLAPYSTQAYHLPIPKTEKLILELTDYRNTLERAMLHFSHLKKETVRIENKQYRITLWYDHEDETELLIRVLSFGPLIHVISPDSFIAKIKDRLKKQKSCGL